MTPVIPRSCSPILIFVCETEMGYVDKMKTGKTRQSQDKTITRQDKAGQELTRQDKKR